MLEDGTGLKMLSSKYNTALATMDSQQLCVLVNPGQQSAQIEAGLTGLYHVLLNC